MEIWINPACSKCRGAIDLLDAEGATYTVRRYLEDVPTDEEIRAVLVRLGLEPWDITRTQEAAAKELGLKEWSRDDSSRDRWIAALAQHPKLIQRPIITADDGTAVVGRTEGSTGRLVTSAGVGIVRCLPDEGNSHSMIQRISSCTLALLFSVSRPRSVRRAAGASFRTDCTIPPQSAL